MVIEKVDRVKVLGVIMDSDFSFHEHCQNVQRRCWAQLSKLYRLRSLLKKSQRSILADSLVMSHIRYCCIVWLTNRKNHMIIDRIIRATARFVMNKRKYDGISDICTNLRILLSKYLYKFETLKFGYWSTFRCSSGVFRNERSISELRTCRIPVYEKTLLYDPNSDQSDRLGEV